jgi:hypothetical protein
MRVGRMLMMVLPKGVLKCETTHDAVCTVCCEVLTVELRVVLPQRLDHSV